MAIRKYLRPSILLTVLFVLSIFVLFFIASISFKQIDTLSKAQESITHSLDVRVDLEKLFSELKDAEAAHRGYLITRDERYLEPYTYSHVRINKSLLAIQKLIQEDPKRQKEFDTLSLLINERFRYFRENTIESNRMKMSSNAFKAKMWQGKQTMDKIRLQINAIVASEEKILKKQEDAHANEIQFTPITYLFIVVFSIIVFLFTFHRINKNLYEMRRLNRRLQLVNETFTYAERIGEISHWQFDIGTKKLTYSDNRFNLLGYNPQAFEPTMENLLAAVHPHDRRKVRESFARQNTSLPVSIYFRIIRKDRKIRFIKSISKRTKDSEGREIVIGIDCDVTAQHQNTMKLERKNKELKSTNAELSSFNHIVSHDLQEPLRKIQMFVSRIDPKDIAAVSETSQMYFSRIQIAANRAQKLIDDLLVYSRLNRNDQKPEFTDLNLLLENAKIDLAQVIEEKQAKIRSELLPSIRVIPHQIQQLFVNLISNSLKYSKDSELPIINITYSIAESRNLPDGKRLPHKKYHELVFTDNGIGFSQDYAERIFVLFKRLHDNEKYSGTGIGLAICKKMVENHDGFIQAYGEPEISATFKVYLPV